MTLLFALSLACAPKPDVIRGERLVTDFTQEYNGAFGVAGGAARHWVGSGQGWGLGPQVAVVAERSYPGSLQWWNSAAWSWHDLQDGTRTFEDGSGRSLTAETFDGQQVLGWFETGILYTPDRGWDPGQLDLRLVMRGTLAVGGVQTRFDLPAGTGRTRIETRDLLIAPNGHLGLQGVYSERWCFRLLFGVSPLLAFDRAELGGGDNGRVTLRTHGTLESLVRF